MNEMVVKLATLWPEMILGIGACLCLITGLSSSVGVRRGTPWVAGIALLASGASVIYCGEFTLNLTSFIKLATVVMGLLLLLAAASVPGQLRQTRDAESSTKKFDAGNVVRGEFFAFFLFSLAGLMLTASADDLVWLFLALELVSLPTYVMVATSRDRIDAQEAAVKYFFLGALAVAFFLYGFTLIYGATGYTRFSDIRTFIASEGISPVMLLGLVLSVVGMSFKIAAVPMHFYAADVYQGANVAVTAFLGFVPKTAGFVSMILLLGLTGDKIPSVVISLLWVIAVLTMTIGNVLGLLQDNVKRALAYSSIAHSGYILVGLIVALTAQADGIALDSSPLGNGIGAVLFYLVVYGLGNLGAFAALGCLRANGQEAQTYQDIGGIVRRHPLVAAIMLVSVLSLLGLPPMAGFIGKIYLFGSAISLSDAHPQLLWLVIIAVLNSAVSAGYYLRIAAACFFGEPGDNVQAAHAPARRIGAALAAIGAIAFGIAGNSLVDFTNEASTPKPQVNYVEQPVPQTAAEIDSVTQR